MRFLLVIALAACGDPIVGAECAEGFTQNGNRCVAIGDGSFFDGGVPADGDVLDAGVTDGHVPDGTIRDARETVDGDKPDGEIADASRFDATVRDGAVIFRDGDLPDGSPSDGGMPDASIACDLGELMCGGRCVRPESDPAHCGECFNACADGDVCVSGVCMPICPDGLIVCGPLCIDPTSDDPDNCGGCGIRCASGLCVDGECVEAIPGHVVIVGHDYETTRAGMNQVAGNSIFLAPGAPVRVLVYEGGASARSIAGVDRAIAQVATDRGRTWTRTVATREGLTLELRTADVFVVYPQTSSNDSELVGLGGDWRVGLATFLRRGGVVVVFETPSETNLGTYRLLEAAGLFSATSITEVSGDAVDVVEPTDGVALGVPVRYRGETATVWFATSDPQVVVQHPDGPVVIHRVFTP
jgi:hypothetical protein